MANQNIGMSWNLKPTKYDIFVATGYNWPIVKAFSPKTTIYWPLITIIETICSNALWCLQSCILGQDNKDFFCFITWRIADPGMSQELKKPGLLDTQWSSIIANPKQWTPIIPNSNLFINISISVYFYDIWWLAPQFCWQTLRLLSEGLIPSQPSV